MSKTMKNRNSELLRIQKELQEKPFKIIKTRKLFPGQSIRLFSDKLANNFPGQILKELNPSEYLRQKQKLQVTKNLQTRKYNKKKSSVYGLQPQAQPSKRGPGTRGSSIRSLKNLNRALKEYKALEASKSKSKNNK